MSKKGYIYDFGWRGGCQRKVIYMIFVDEEVNVKEMIYMILDGWVDVKERLYMILMDGGGYFVRYFDNYHNYSFYPPSSLRIWKEYIAAYN